MAKSRINTIKPPCGYSLEGVSEILFLDFEDFVGFKFNGDNLYSNCLVVAIQRTGNLIEIESPDLIAKYSSQMTGGIYAHSIETFISDLTADTLENLHLASKRRQVPVFKTKVGRYYTFGYEAGATVTYANQTAGEIGSVVTVTAASIYPLFEVTAAAIAAFTIPTEFIPDFTNGAYCEII